MRVRDVVDILQDRYPVRLELSNQMRMNTTVVRVNLRGNLEEVLADLAANEHVNIHYTPKSRSGHFLLHHITGEATGLTPDYSFQDHFLGHPLAQ